MKKFNYIIILIFSISILISAYVLTRPTYVHLVFEVKAADDDARTFITGLGSGNEDGKWAVLQLSPSYSFGLRFTNVTIPKNIKIKDVYIELYSIGTPGHSHPNCRIYGDLSENASNFTVKGVLDICGRNYTKHYVRWNETVEYGKWIRTPSITPVLEEIIKNESWNPGDPIVILFITEGVRGFSAAFQNFENGYPARLHIIFKE